MARCLNWLKPLGGQSLSRGQNSPSSPIILLCITAFFLLLASCSAAIPAPPATEQPTADSPAPSPTPQVCKVSTGYDNGRLNLRTGPGVEYAVIRVLAEGEVLTVLIPSPVLSGDEGILSEDKGWLAVIDAEGRTGYVNSRYCTD